VDDLNVVAVRFLPAQHDGPALPDDAFRHDGQITKQTIRTLTVAALAPRVGERLWDIGSGSGSIAVQWCRSAPDARAIAFEADPQRAQNIAHNARAFGVDVAVRGEAPGTFDGAPRPDAVFIGGGITTPGMVQACLDRLNAGGRLVANAVTAESEALLVEWYSRLGGQLSRFQHYRGEPLGGFTGWRPQMPITQWIVSTL
jgi:precorrin-6Y C5,15-methyltransferase (decarboxylating)